MLVRRGLIQIVQRDGQRCNPREAFSLDDILVDMSANGFDPSKPLEVLDMGDGTYGLLDGERRLRCATKLKLTEVPIHIVGHARNYPGDALFNMVVMHCLSSGNQRPLNPVEVGKGAISLLRDGTPLAQIARKAGYSVALLETAIDLVNAPAEIRSKVIGGQMSLSAYQKLKHLGTETLRKVGAQDGRVTRKTAEQIVKGMDNDSPLVMAQDDLFGELAGMRERLRVITGLLLGPREKHVLLEISSIAGETRGTI